MYAIMNANDDCIGILGNYKSAVREAKRMKAKYIKEIKNVSAYTSGAGRKVWKKKKNMLVNRAIGLCFILLGVVIGIICKQTGEGFDAVLLMWFLGIVMMFCNEKVVL